MKKLLTISMLAFLGTAYVGTVYAPASAPSGSEDNSTHSAEQEKPKGDPLNKSVEDLKIGNAKLTVGTFKSALSRSRGVAKKDIEIHVDSAIPDDVGLTVGLLEKATVSFSSSSEDNSTHSAEQEKPKGDSLKKSVEDLKIGNAKLTVGTFKSAFSKLRGVEKKDIEIHVDSAIPDDVDLTAGLLEKATVVVNK